MTLIALLGDVHGAWDRATQTLNDIERKFGRIAFAVAVGDSEPYRSTRDMEGSTSPPKYLSLGHFPEVMAGRMPLACPVYFIGGNHDPYVALEEMGAGHWGGNAHYLGRVGVTEIEGVRVGFISGIYSPTHFPLVRARRDGEPDVVFRKRLTHYNEAEIMALRAVGKVDLLVTHDWPSGVPQSGPRQFPGDPMLRELHGPLSPSLHAAGHCHSRCRVPLDAVQFHALPHGTNSGAVALYRFHRGAFEFVSRTRTPSGTSLKLPFE